jgi:hypothetical protein
MSEATVSVQAAEPARISADWLSVLIGLGVFGLVSFFGVPTGGFVAPETLVFPMR